MLRRAVVACLLAVWAVAVAGCGENDASTVNPLTPTLSSEGRGSPTAASTTTNASPSPAQAAATATPATPTSSTAAKRLGSPSGVPHSVRAPDFRAATGATAKFGQLGGAAYRIEVPADWNGSLVLFAHGIRLTGAEVFVSNPPEPLRQAFLRGGYAWAASSYSENFYVPGIGADDTLALLDFFAKEVGAPRHVYLVGESMGGHITTLLLEQFPDRFDGALAVCGAVAGQEQIDFLVSWLAIAEAVTGMTAPLEQGQAAVAGMLLQSLPAALGSPPNLTPAGQQFASAIQALTGGPRAYFAEGLALQLQPNFGLFLLDPKRERLASAAATNADVAYAIDPAFGLAASDLNAKARRFAADPAKRNAAGHPGAVPTTGKIATPLLTLHNTGDLFVPISQEQSYRRKVEAAGAGQLLVQRAIRAAGHCQFSDQELTQAWADLVGWVEAGKKPAGDDLLGDLFEAGIAFTQPTRNAAGKLP
ncbi:MAG: serine aminopeptidase domain-containing protein [Dehalococcoidia bacterium]